MDKEKFLNMLQEAGFDAVLEESIVMILCSRQSSEKTAMRIFKAARELAKEHGYRGSMGIRYRALNVVSEKEDYKQLTLF